MAEVKAACGRCRYVYLLPRSGKDHDGNEIAVGQCRIRPPTALLDGKSAFPIVGVDNGWCGEFKAAPARRSASPRAMKKGR